MFVTPGTTIIMRTRVLNLKRTGVIPSTFDGRIIGGTGFIVKTLQEAEVFKLLWKPKTGILKRKIQKATH